MSKGLVGCDGKGVKECCGVRGAMKSDMSDGVDEKRCEGEV